MDGAHPELIFGLVGAIGTDFAQVEDALRNSLNSVGYVAILIKLSDLRRELNPPWSSFPERGDPKYCPDWQAAHRGGHALGWPQIEMA
jgi:hypothetical protein